VNKTKKNGPVRLHKIDKQNGKFAGAPAKLLWSMDYQLVKWVKHTKPGGKNQKKWWK
jgi:hypothetical protein